MSNEELKLSQGNCFESSHVDEHCSLLSPALLTSNPPASTYTAAAMSREGPRPEEIEKSFPAEEVPADFLKSERDQSPAFNLRFPPHLSEPLREVTRQNIVSTPSSQQGKSECRDSLMSKINKLSQELHKFNLTSDHCRIEISRNNMFGDSCKQIMKLKPVELRKKLLINFKWEKGSNYGIAREWLFLLSWELFNPCFGLFDYTSDLNYLQINPNSHTNPNHLYYFSFVGRIIGLSIYHGHHLEANFAKPFLKQLLKLPLDILDIEAVDIQLYKSLLWIKENDITGVSERTFSVVNNTFGEHVTHELKPAGEDIPVTEENKKEYIDLYVKWRLQRGCESQMEALLKGFHEVIPHQLLVDFEVEDIEQMIGGLSSVDVGDWRKHTKLKHCTMDSNVVRWFWKAVEESDDERRRKILKFVLGSSRFPLQGFKALQDSQGPEMFTIYQWADSTSNPPRAHTCFNGISIPSYESYEEFIAKLNCAIDETKGMASNVVELKLYPQNDHLELLHKEYFSRVGDNLSDEIKVEILQYSYYHYMDKCIKVSTKKFSFEQYGRYISNQLLSELFPDFVEMHCKYKEYMETALRCGAVVLNEDESSILVMKGFGCDYWSIPSGKQEPSESDIKCASRELFEETGIKIEFKSQSQPLIITGNKFDRRYYVFVGLDEEIKLRPEVNEEVEQLA